MFWSTSQKKISCLFEITKAESGSRKNMAIKFVDTDREEFKFVISEFEGAYIYKYDYSSLVSFFDRNIAENSYLHTPLRFKTGRTSGYRWEGILWILKNFLGRKWIFSSIPH